jgi:hypothetical protein
MAGEPRDTLRFAGVAARRIGDIASTLARMVEQATIARVAVLAAIGAQTRVLPADPLWDWVTGEPAGGDPGQSPAQLL